MNPEFERPACAKFRPVGRRQAKLEMEMLNPKLKTLNSKQTQISKPQNSKPSFQSFLSFSFWACLGFRV